MKAEPILIVDDEREIADLLEVYLKNENYVVRKFYNPLDALDCIEKEPISLVILDVMMPEMDGFTLCQKIRQKYLFPIIMLTAKIEDIDKIQGLTLGADDYIVKPFNPLEVVARVKTQLRRYKQYNVNSADPTDEPTEYDDKGLYICPASHKCTLNGETLPLTPFEFHILWYLCKNHGRVVSAEELFETIWGEKFFESNNNTVMAHIARIREKMSEPPRKPRYIKTVWGGWVTPLNKQTSQETGSRVFHKRLALRTTIQFITVVIIFEVAYILLNLLFLIIMGTTNLDRTEAFQAFKPFMIPIMVVVSIAGCGYISYRFMLRPLEHLDEVAEAAQKLAHPTDAPIMLSGNLKSMEEDLNRVREQTLNSIKSAQETEQRKDDLLVYLAHDLKTPLTSVLGYLKLIEDEPEITPELVHKYSGIARKKAQRLEELINEFFEITRFSTIISRNL